MPVWATVFVGIGSGLLSGLAGTLATITHQRGAEMRTRMLVAAEEFIRAAEDCRKAIRVARRDLNADTYEKTTERYDDLVPAVTLIELLYGYSSTAAIYAKCVGSDYIDAKNELAKGPGHDESVVTEAMNDFSARFTMFGEAAADQVRRGWLRRKLRPLGPELPQIPEGMLADGVGPGGDPNALAR